jgi:transposase
VPPSQSRKASGEEPKPKGRRRRKAHAGSWRALDPDPAQTVELKASRCPHCQADVSGARQRLCEAYDHLELPQVTPDVTRVKLFGGHCPHCAGRFKAAAPADMPPGSPFGANLRALVIYLRYTQGISFERLARLLHDFYGLTVSQGALINMLDAAAGAFAAQTSRIRARLLASSVLESDETGMRVGKRNFWLWVVHHKDSAVFLADPTRAKRVLGDFLDGHRPDFWISDRYGAQKGFAAKQHQFCLAHLIRDAQYAADAGDECFAPGLTALFKRACRVGRERDRFSDRQLAAWSRKFVKRLSGLLRLRPAHSEGVNPGSSPGPRRHRRNPAQSVRFRHQPRARRHQQRVRTILAALRHLPQNHQRFPHRMGRKALRRHKIRHRNRPAPNHPAPPRLYPHAPRMPLATPNRLTGVSNHL